MRADVNPEVRVLPFSSRNSISFLFQKSSASRAKPGAISQEPSPTREDDQAEWERQEQEVGLKDASHLKSEDLRPYLAADDDATTRLRAFDDWRYPEHPGRTSGPYGSGDWRT